MRRRLIEFKIARMYGTRTSLLALALLGLLLASCASRTPLAGLEPDPKAGVDAASGRIVASEGDDALDSLATLVLARGGEVHVVEASSMPTSTGVAAELH